MKKLIENTFIYISYYQAYKTGMTKKGHNHDSHLNQINGAV